MYIVLETQTHSNGTVGTLIDTFDDGAAAENKYHLILAAAAISTLPRHSAFMLSDAGHLIKSETYEHEQQVEE